MDIRTHPESGANIMNILRSTLHEYSSPKHPLYGGIYEVKGSNILGSEKDGMFLIMSKDPAFDGERGFPEGFDVFEANAREARGDGMFHPNMRVISIDSLNEDTSILQSIVLWARTNEFLSRVYDKYGATVPDHIRQGEIDYLSEHMQAMEGNIPDKARAKLSRNLRRFFAAENATGFRKKWLEFFRSDRYPGGKNKLKQLWYFLRRKSNVVPLGHLWKTTGSICVVPMTERDYKKFAKAVKAEFPGLTYAVSKKFVRDEGLDKKTGPTMFEGVRRVSEDEYAAIREKRFADEGWDCLRGLEPAKWETRKVYVKGDDASLVDGILLRYRLSWARPYPVDEIMKYGQCRVREIEERDFANFVSLAKYNHVPFAIDTEGVARFPKPNFTHVIYPVAFERKVTSIFNRIVNDAIQNSHDEKPMPRHKQALFVEILRAEEISREERAGRPPKRELPPKERQ